MNNKIDIKENYIYKLDSKLMSILLKDNSSGKNIIWATDNYIVHGHGYKSTDQIAVMQVTGHNGNIIKPRVAKSQKEQTIRIREKAEVFTPSWICNKQNNLVDNAWFGYENIFNKETKNGWQSIKRQVKFSSKSQKNWQDYIRTIRMEISCGEAPYLVSRYDTVSGNIISVDDRIGLLDRKLRVVSENTRTEKDWLKWAKIAFKSIYGYDWQGDNVLLARENLLLTFVDYYEKKFNIFPSLDYLIEIAIIISWNIWQMDGLKFVIPESCTGKKIVTEDFFTPTIEYIKCQGCQENDIHQHSGIYCKIMDWETRKTIRFIDLM